MNMPSEPGRGSATEPTTEPLLGGCTKCGQRFPVYADADGNPIWTHICPKTTNDRIDELTTLVKGLAEKLNNPEVAEQ